MNMKRCRQCLWIKFLSAFYPDPTCADGHRTECKACTRRNNLENKALKKLARVA
jgi:hypothetical protein